MINKQMMANSRLYEGATGEKRALGAANVVMKGNRRPKTAYIEVHDVGSLKSTTYAVDGKGKVLFKVAYRSGTYYEV